MGVYNPFSGQVSSRSNFSVSTPGVRWKQANTDVMPDFPQVLVITEKDTIDSERLDAFEERGWDVTVYRDIDQVVDHVKKYATDAILVQLSAKKLNLFLTKLRGTIRNIAPLAEHFSKRPLRVIVEPVDRVPPLKPFASVHMRLENVKEMSDVELERLNLMMRSERAEVNV
jgi:hypothetical protein